MTKTTLHFSCQLRRLGIVLAMPAILALSGCGKDSPETRASSPELPPITVKAEKLEPTEHRATLSFTGTVRARRQAVLSTRLAGRIIALSAEEGDVVSAGTVVAEIDAEDIAARTRQAQAGQSAAQATLRQAEAGTEQAGRAVEQAKAQVKALADQQGEAQARLELAQKDFERYQLLAREGAIPRQQSEQATSELRVAQSRLAALQSQMAAAQVSVRQAEAGLAQAQSGVAVSSAGIDVAAAGVAASSTDLAYSKVTSPFRGVVVEKLAYQGELNTPGRPLLKLQDLDSLEVTATVPESTLPLLPNGSRVKGEVPGLDKTVDLAVRQVVASTDPASRTVEIRMLLLGKVPNLFPGSFVRVLVPQPARKVLAIPKSAVVTRGQLEGAFVVAEPGVAQFRLLQLAAEDGGQREVLSGLKGGETVILDPPEGLVDGRKVSL